MGFKTTSRKFRELAKKAGTDFEGVKDKDLSSGLIHLTKAIEKIERELRFIHKKLK